MIHFSHPSGGPVWSRDIGYHHPGPLPAHIRRTANSQTRIVAAENDPALCGMCNEQGIGYVVMPWGAVRLCIHHWNEHIELGYTPVPDEPRPDTEGR